METTETIFGTINNHIIKKVTLINRNKLEVNIINFGGIIQSVRIPDKNGGLQPVTLGYDTPLEYLKDKYYFGCIVGRYANRIKNGIFEIDGKAYTLEKNEASTGSHLHGGSKGFHKVFWDMKLEKKEDESSVLLSYLSKDNEEGFPGNLSVNVKYTLSEKNELITEYNAETDKTTPVNLTQHTYWNINAFQNSKTILEQNLTLYCSSFLPLDNNFIPTGKTLPVENTPYDFTKGKEIGKDIEKLSNGYDIYFISDNENPDLKKLAKVSDEQTGRSLEIFSTAPGLQFYSSNFLKNVSGYKNALYDKYAALCLEPHDYPDSINRNEFKKSIIKPGEKYFHKTIYKFGF